MAGARVQALAQWLSQYGVPGAAWRSQNTQGRSALVIQAQVGRLTLGAGTVGCFLTVRVGIAPSFTVTFREVRQPGARFVNSRWWTLAAGRAAPSL
jgi:hypothetical protein